VRFIRSKLTFANVVALLALFIALGGSAYAFHLGKNAVKTKNIKDGAVVESKLAGGAVTEGKIANAAVTASKLAAGAVKTPSVVVRVASKPLTDSSNAVPIAVCHPGEVAVGGGAHTSNDGNGTGDIVLADLRPLQASQANAGEGDTPGAYQADYVNAPGGTGSVTVFAYALCMK
jgi:hypothetical protein